MPQLSSSYGNRGEQRPPWVASRIRPGDGGQDGHDGGWGGRPRFTARHQSGFLDVRQERLAHGIGWFAIALGLVQLAAPNGLGRMIGVGRRPLLMRAMGAREVLSGVGVLRSPRPGRWLGARLGGDIVDMALLGLAMASGTNRRTRVALALAAVAGVAALDLVSSQQVASHPRAKPRERPRTGTIPVRVDLVVNKSPQECHAFWRDFSNFPRFMRHVEDVRILDDKRSHWTVSGPAGRHLEWDAEIVEDVPGERIAWKAGAKAEVPNAGVVRFEPATGGRGTIVRLRMHYRPPAGELGSMVAHLFGQAPELQARHDLRRFKQVLETGEVPTTAGQPSGRRTAAARLMKKVSP
jgi:uncharacterized membrane protein